MESYLLEIIKHYGVKNQQRKLNEEVFELNEAISLHKHDEEVTCGVDDVYFKYHIKEEIADCMVMLEQFRLYYDIPIEEIKKVMEFKIGRQLNRMKEEE